MHRHGFRTLWISLMAVALAMLLAAAFALDRPLSTMVHQHRLGHTGELITSIMQWPGYFWFTVVVAIIVFFTSRRSWESTIIVLASGILAGAIGAVLKWGVGRLRPFKGAGVFAVHPFIHGLPGLFDTPNLTFPSGHVVLAASTAAAAFLIRSPLRWVLAIWAALTMCARVLKGAHYPSDVVAALIIGILSACLIWKISRGIHENS